MEKVYFRQKEYMQGHESYKAHPRVFRRQEEDQCVGGRMLGAGAVGGMRLE